MILKPPFEISSRLLPSLRIKTGTLSLEYADIIDAEDRDVYTYYIDIMGLDGHASSSIRSAVGGGTLQEGFQALLSFLSAAAESYAKHLRYPNLDLENLRMFPMPINEWAYIHSDEIVDLWNILEDSEEPLIEE